MPKRVPPLTAKTIENWRPDPSRVLERPDGAVPGLWARLTPRGELSWSLNTYVQGVRRRIAVGKELKLSDARRRAEQMRSLIADGGDPTEARKAALERSKSAAKGLGTLRAVVASYYEHGPGTALLSRAAARQNVERIFKDHLPRPALDVSTAQLQLTLDAYPSKSSAKHAAAYMRPIIKWAAKRGLMTKGDPLEAPTQAPVQQLVLSHAEVGKLWSSLAERRRGMRDVAAMFMLLTGTRRTEVCEATWDEVDLDRRQWVIPGSRRKDARPHSVRGARTGEDHTVPLSRQALALLERVKDASERSETLVFPNPSGKALDNWPRWSRGVQVELGFLATPHSLRRTCATLAGDVGAAPHVVSALLGHRSIGGALHSGYNQSRYTAEVSDALQRIADFLDTLADGKDNVVTLVGKQRKV